jgi:hypothetical protein
MKTRVVQMEKISVGATVVCTSSMVFLHNNITVGRKLTVTEIDTDITNDYAMLKDDEWFYYVTLGDLYLNFEHVNLV